MNKIKFLSLGLVLVLLWAMPASSQNIVEFPGTNDSYIHNLDPNSTFGSDDGMLIGAKDGAEGSICHSYVQFDMAGYDGDVVFSAILHFYVGEAAPSDTEQSFSLYLGAGDSWSQDSLTWNNAPGFLPEPLGVRSSIFQPGWVSFDVSTVVSSASEVGGKISFVAIQNSGPQGSWLRFITTEGSPDISQRPYLGVRFEGTVPNVNTSLDAVKALYLN